MSLYILTQIKRSIECNLDVCVLTVLSAPNWHILDLFTCLSIFSIDKAAEVIVNRRISLELLLVCNAEIL